MRELASLLCATLAMCALSSPVQASDAARAAFGEAREHFAQGDVRAARIELMNAIKDDPDWIDARVFQAEVLLRLFDGIGAQAELDRAIELGLAPERVRHLYGHALLLQGKLRPAREQLEQGDIPAEAQAYAMRILGKLALQIGDPELATRAFDRSIALDPASSDLWVDIAQFRAGSANQIGAQEAVAEAVRLAPANVRALQYRGELIRSQFGLTAALPWFERGLQIDPNDVALLTEYAATLGDMGRASDMLAVARKIIALDGDNPRAFFMQAVIAARGQKPALARVLMQKTGEALDDVPAAILLRGVIENAEDNHNAAVEEFRRLVAMQPANDKARRLLARSLHLAGDPDEALPVLLPAVEREGAAAYSLWQAARSMERVGRGGDSVAFLHRAARHLVEGATAPDPGTPIDVLAAEARRAPGNARAAIPYIRALIREGRAAEAVGIARAMQEANAGTSDAHALVADAALAAGQYDAALVALKRAAAIRFSEPVMLRTVEALRAQGKTRDAEAVVAQFLTYNPNNIAALRWMAYQYLEAGDWGRAAAILEDLNDRLGPNDALVLAGLAQAYGGMERGKLAVEHGALAYAVQPSSAVVSHLYGRALLQSPGRADDALALIEKAVAIAPANATYRDSLKQALKAAAG